MPTTPKSTFFSGLAIGLISIQSAGQLINAQILSPGSIILVIPLYAGLSFLWIPIFSALCYWIWSYQMFKSINIVPMRTWIAYVTVFLLSIIYFIYSWNLGIKYQGFYTTLIYAILSFAFAAFGFIAYTLRNRDSASHSLAVHFLLFVWIFTYAFPYFGESV